MKICKLLSIISSSFMLLLSTHRSPTHLEVHHQEIAAQFLRRSCRDPLPQHAVGMLSRGLARLSNAVFFNHLPLQQTPNEMHTLSQTLRSVDMTIAQWKHVSAVFLKSAMLHSRLDHPIFVALNVLEQLNEIQQRSLMIVQDVHTLTYLHCPTCALYSVFLEATYTKFLNMFEYRQGAEYSIDCQS